MEQHQPVLLNQVIEVLMPKEGEVFADLTAGYGGHSSRLLQAVGKNGFGYLYDTDREAVEFLKNKFKNQTNLEVRHNNFADISIDELPKVDMILLDLGVSSPQLKKPARGFSFQSEGPLDMRLDQTKGLTAAEIVNVLPANRLANLLRSYGQVPNANRIARSIIEHRPISSTTQLAEIVEKASYKRGKIHPATKVFQALRIAVNDELEQLKLALPQLIKHLRPGGRIAVISFHSGEDRIVKNFLRAITADKLDNFGRVEDPAQFQIVTKKAIKGEEFDTNPRARSARLRAAVKLTKTKGE